MTRAYFRPKVDRGMPRRLRSGIVYSIGVGWYISVAKRVKHHKLALFRPSRCTTDYGPGGTPVALALFWANNFLQRARVAWYWPSLGR